MFTLDNIVTRIFHSKFSNFLLKLPKVLRLPNLKIVTKFARAFDMTIWFGNKRHVLIQIHQKKKDFNNLFE